MVPRENLEGSGARTGRDFTCWVKYLSFEGTYQCPCLTSFVSLRKIGGAPVIILLYYLALDDQDESFIASVELGYAYYRFFSALYSQNRFNKRDICFTF